MRTEIQNRILSLCKAGTFATVSYDAATKLATKSEDVTVPVTNSSDAVPSGLQGEIIWHDSGTTENGEVVWYDPTDTYAIWNNGTGKLISVIGDVGETPTDYFKFQDYPDTITVSGAGESAVDGDYDYKDDMAFHYWVRAAVVGDKISPLGSGWRIDLGFLPQYNSLNAHIPPKDSSDWSVVFGSPPLPTLTYTIPTNQYVGQGLFSGTITLSSSIIPAVLDTPRVEVNEVSGTLTRSVKAGARSGNVSMVNWIFEARLKFNREVSVEYFLKNELKMVSFVKDNERVTAVSTGFPIVQPPRQKPHNGTEMVITFSVNTRR